jgi:TolB-like protein
MKQLLSELRRRNVFRVAAAYMVVGWMVMQIVSVMTPALELPGWVDGFFAVLLMAGLPIALLLAWAFEMTPAGVKKTESVEGDIEMRPLGSTDFVLIGLMVVVVGMVGYQMFGPDDPVVPTETAEIADVSQTSPSTPITDIETVDTPVLDASIAVLPFADFSPEGDQQYFSDGISEELLNALAQFRDLRVAARTSAFSFRGEVDLREVGEALGVAHVLEGSVRQSGDRVRITAQLIRVSDGFHLWSETYERTMTDVFEIQDEIVEELSRVLQVRLGVGAGTGRVTDRNVDPLAYEQYLRGLSLWASRAHGDNRWEAVQTLARATEIDSEFADAWASYGLGLVSSSLVDYGMSPDENKRLGLSALERSLELNPDNARAHAGLSNYFGFRVMDIDRSLEHGRRALEIAPNAAYSNYALATALGRAGDIAGSFRAFDRAISIDRLNDLPKILLALQYTELGLAGPLQTALDDCGSCDEAFRHNLMRRAAFQSGSEEQVMRAFRDWSDWVMSQADGTEERQAELEGYVALLGDYRKVLLGEADSGQILIAGIDDQFADTEDASVLARAGEDDRAIEILFNLFHGDSVVDDLTTITTPGRYEFPERTRRHPRYHEFWQLPGMARLAEVRRANGQTAGLPLPMDTNTGEPTE